MSRPVLFKGVDVAVPLTYKQCEALKAANYKFVCRYYTDYLNPRHKWKLLLKDEAKLISHAGLDIVAVYQTGSFDSKIHLKESGKQDCINAIRCAEMIGQPKNTTIYFVVESFVAESQESRISEYFLGVSEEMQKFKEVHNNDGWNIGAYGSYYNIENIYSKHGVFDCWQTVYKSKGKIFNKLNLLQYKKTKFTDYDMNEIDIDIDFSLSPFFGQFRI